MKIKSRAQHGLLGAIASGRANIKDGPSRQKARKLLEENRGIKLKRLPKRVPRRSGRR